MKHSEKDSIEIKSELKKVLKKIYYKQKKKDILKPSVLKGVMYYTPPKENFLNWSSSAEFVEQRTTKSNKKILFSKTKQQNCCKSRKKSVPQ